MRNLFYFLLLSCVIGNSVLAQSVPNKIHFQGVVFRDDVMLLPGDDINGAPLVQTPIMLRFSFRNGSSQGPIEFQEEQSVTTDEFGRFSCNIGEGQSSIGQLSNLSWLDVQYFLEVEIDVTNTGDSFRVSSNQEFTSVPYALVANYVAVELDPIFVSSPAFTISAVDISSWNNKVAVEVDPLYVASPASGIAATDITSWNNKVGVEGDPLYTASPASGISTADITSWNNKVGVEVDPLFTASTASSISAADITSWNNKVAVEADPLYTAAPASGILASDIVSWNNKVAVEADPLYAAAPASGILASDIVSWNNKVAVEVDPLFTASPASSIAAADITSWNNKVAVEVDPLYAASPASGISATDITSWNNKLAVEGDPLFTASTAFTINASDVINWNEKIRNVVNDSSNSAQVLFELNSNSKAFGLPRMTLFERDNSNIQRSGSMIFCEDCGTGEVQMFNGSYWVSMIPSTSLGLPEVLTAGAANGSNTISLNGSILSDGGLPLVRVGFKISTDVSFSTIIDSVVSLSQVGSLSSNWSNFVSGSTYYYRIFACNSLGCVTGQTSSFTSAVTNPSLPTVSLDSIGMLTSQSAKYFARLLSDGASSILERGYVVSNSPLPTLSNTKIVSGSIGEAFDYLHNGLSSSNGAHYVRAYATNGIGTAYSNQLSFQLIPSQSSNIVVGMNYGGGTVFYVSPDGNSGLIVTDQSIGATSWGCSGSFLNGTSKGIWSSESNTDFILSNCSAQNSAAKMCSDLVRNGYDDWFLPSWDEVILMRQNLFNAGLGGLVMHQTIWTSSEYDANVAYAYDWSCLATLPKTSIANVRAVRKFELGTPASYPSVQLSGVTSGNFSSFSILGSVSLPIESKVFERGLVYSTSPNPTLSSGKKNLMNHAIEGCGASVDFANYSTNQIFGSVNGLTTNTLYYVRAYAISPNGVFYSNEKSVKTDSLYLTNGSGVTDIDGNTYSTVVIGQVEWMAENLRTSKFKNGDPIPYVVPGPVWESLTTPAYTYYQMDPSNNLLYGKLYNWYAVGDSRGICPNGWHVATDAEWLVLEGVLGGPLNAGGAIKSKSNLWVGQNIGATNSVGFAAEPNGVIWGQNSQDKGRFSTFWTGTSFDSGTSFYRITEIHSAVLVDWHGRRLNKSYGMGCRCVKD